MEAAQEAMKEQTLPEMISKYQEFAKVKVPKIKKDKRFLDQESKEQDCDLPQNYYMHKRFSDEQLQNINPRIIGDQGREHMNGQINAALRLHVRYRDEPHILHKGQWVPVSQYNQTRRIVKTGSVIFD